MKSRTNFFKRFKSPADKFSHEGAASELLLERRGLAVVKASTSLLVGEVPSFILALIRMQLNRAEGNVSSARCNSR